MKNNIKKYCAIFGISISLLSWLIIGIFPRQYYLPEEIKISSEATRSHSFYANITKSVDDGPIRISSILEKWSWEVPKRLAIGEDALLKLKCKIINIQSTIQSTPLGRDIPIEESHHPVEKIPDKIGKSFKIQVSGDFGWGEETTKDFPAETNNPLEWDIIFTARTSGKKLIKVTLPQFDKSTELRTDRQFLEENSNTNPKKQYFVIPISVADKEPLSPWARLILQFLGWLVGPAFTAPWIIWLIRRYSAQKS